MYKILTLKKKRGTENTNFKYSNHNLIPMRNLEWLVGMDVIYNFVFRLKCTFEV